MEPRTDELAEQIKALLEAKNYPELKKLLVATEPQDIALLFEELDESSLPVLIRLLPQDLAALSFSEMSPDIQETLIKRFTDAELRAILDEMYIDDTVDVIEEMPANIVKRILANSDKESREQINKILRYPEDSAGSIMTVEYVRLEKNMSVADAFSRIRRVGTEKETIYTC
ncbi:MAG: magnesium transporter, partial [Clostridiales bacterium]|nr:magnesium transporter [Candidatus Coliplasma equi]